MTGARGMRRAGAGLAAVALAAMAPGAVRAAAAAPPPPAPVVSAPTCAPARLHAVTAVVGQQLADRATRLSTLTRRVGAATRLSASDAQSLQARLAADMAGIAGLQSSLPGATRCAAVVATARTMVDAYRVYMVVTPQTDLAIVADAETSIIGVVQGKIPQISTALARAGAAGKDTSVAQAAFTDLQARLSSAAGRADGVAATVLAQTPAGAPDNQSVFTAAYGRLVAARADLEQARDDLQTIVAQLG